MTNKKQPLTFLLFFLCLINLFSYISSDYCTIYKCIDDKVRKNLTNTVCRWAKERPIEYILERNNNETKRKEQLEKLNILPLRTINSTDDEETTYLELNLMHCPAGMRCQSDVLDPKGKSKCIKLEDMTNKVPMSSCKKNEECASGKCQNGLCLGLKTNEACTDNRQCDIGLYCSIDLTTATNSLNSTNSETSNAIGLCKSQRKIGEFCVEDEDCVNDAGCLGSICTKYFSLKLGNYTNNPRLCETFYDYLNLSTLSYQCANSTNNYKEDPTHTCHIPMLGMCSYFIFTGDFAETTADGYDYCHCTFTGTPTLKCPYDSGEIAKHEGFKILKEFTKKETFYLHTTQRFNYAILEPSKREKVFKLLKFPNFDGAPRCVIDYYLYENNDFLKIKLLVVLISLILTYII